ncbi:MAG: hypothetical protein IPG63_14145 [Xanthomonadales bacterium]|nr:hypothetical protein [Xanthomonadales bacterium]
MNAFFSARRRRGDFTTQFGAFLFLVVFPATFTAVAPRTTVALQRDASGVRVTTCAHTLFFIPYWCQHERDVRRVELEFSSGERVGFNAHLSEYANRVNRRGKTEDNATIHFLGAGEGASAMVEVDLMDEVLAQAQGFIDDPQSRALDLSFYAHRVMGLYVGGLLSLLVLLWLPLAGLAIVRRVLGRPYWPFDA